MEGWRKLLLQLLLLGPTSSVPQLLLHPGPVELLLLDLHGVLLPRSQGRSRRSHRDTVVDPGDREGVQEAGAGSRRPVDDHGGREAGVPQSSVRGEEGGRGELLVTAWAGHKKK